MDYVDFELEIGAAGEGRYQLNLRSPAGELESAVVLHVPTDLIELSRSFHRAGPVRGESDGSRGIDRKPAVSERDSIAAARALGEGLFNTLFERQAYGRYCESIGRVGPSKGLRLRLTIESPELATIPWEFLFDSSKKEFLTLSPATPITRYLKVGEPRMPLAIEPPLRILAMIASPQGPWPLKVDVERERMENALGDRIKAGAVQLEWVDGGTYDALQRALARGPWHVFHFIGHGGFDPAAGESGEGIILLCSEDGAGVQRVRASALADLLRLRNRDSLRLVVLNSCEGARSSGTDSFSSTSGAIIRAGVPAVVSMQYEISDRAALTFSRMFYDSLASTNPIDVAVTEARVAINGQSEKGTVEWATPVLHLRSENGRLFDVGAARSVFGDAGPVARSEASPRLSAQMRVPAAPAKKHVASEALRGLDVLRQKVRRAWIDGVLARDLELAPLIELGMEMLGGMVESEPGMPASPEAVAVPSAQTIRDVFRAQGGSLLILGEPGAGKTTALLTIARDLLDRADADPAAPVPVIFNLASWAATSRPIAAWMADELAEKYAVPADVGRVWLGVDCLVPFLDGLDEVRSDARPACVSAINRFQEETNLAAMVAACRFKEYVQQPARLTLNAAVRLQRLTLDQVWRVVAAGEERLAALAQELLRDAGLLIEARSPLMLSIMIQAYRDVPAEQLQHESTDTAEARRAKVWSAYVARKLRLAGALR